MTDNTNLIPERLTVMWQNSRKTRHGWEVPIQVASTDSAIGGGNVVATVLMGGPGAIISTKEAVEATAAEIVRAYNAARNVERVTPYTPPRYDEVFAAGTAALDEAD
jgi:hypothetical protein